MAAECCAAPIHSTALSLDYGEVEQVLTVGTAFVARAGILEGHLQLM